MPDPEDSTASSRCSRTSIPRTVPGNPSGTTYGPSRARARGAGQRWRAARGPPVRSGSATVPLDDRRPLDVGPPRDAVLGFGVASDADVVREDDDGGRVPWMATQPNAPAAVVADHKGPTIATITPLDTGSCEVTTGSNRNSTRPERGGTAGGGPRRVAVHTHGRWSPRAADVTAQWVRAPRGDDCRTRDHRTPRIGEAPSAHVRRPVPRVRHHLRDQAAHGAGGRPCQLPRRSRRHRPAPADGRPRRPRLVRRPVGWRGRELQRAGRRFRRGLLRRGLLRLTGGTQP